MTFSACRSGMVGIEGPARSRDDFNAAVKLSIFELSVSAPLPELAFAVVVLGLSLSSGEGTESIWRSSCKFVLSWLANSLASV